MLCPKNQHSVRRPEFRSRWSKAVELSAGYYPSVRQRHQGFPSAAQDVFVCVTLQRIVTLFFCALQMFLLTYLLTYFTCLETFLARFDKCVKYMDWNEKDQLFNLSISLEGAAVGYWR